MKCVVVGCVAVCSIFAVGCTAKGNYFEKVSSYSFWSNKGSESIAQYQYYNIMNDFLKDGEIDDGNVVKNGKTKKVAFVGWDGTRTDSLTNMMHDDNDFTTNDYVDQSEFSGLAEMRKTGGLYMSYCGGEKGNSAQDTSTSAGWTSEFTGVWATEHGVVNNDTTKNDDKKTIMLQYAEMGLQTSLSFGWGHYFDAALKNEVKFLMENPQVKLSYKDIDRKIAKSVDEAKANEKIKPSGKLFAESLELYNHVARENVLEKQTYDSAMRDNILERIAGGDDMVMGLFDYPDANGHNRTFSNDNSAYINAVRNADNYVYQILEVLKQREIDNNEEWLVIVTTDHGGSGHGHGKQVLEHRTTWVACNKPIDAKYFGKNYDGFKEN